MRTALAKAQERAGKGFWPDAAVARTEFLPFDPLNGVAEEDEIALFDHLQPVFGGRFTGTSLLKYVL
jgi:hypothetical protein